MMEWKKPIPVKIQGFANNMATISNAMAPTEAALGIAYHAKPVVRAQARLAVTASGLDAITLLFIEAWR